MSCGMWNFYAKGAIAKFLLDRGGRSRLNERDGIDAM